MSVIKEEKVVNNNDNKALIAGGLTSSLGIFISKMLGVVYVIPFNRLIGETASVFYSYAYTYYDYLLTLSIAGLPFAISLVVARYYTKEDYKTVLSVRKIARNLLLALGFVSFLILTLFAGPIAQQISGTSDAEYITSVKTVLYIISLALLVVPVLSSIRGFYQGQKEFVASAVSEVIEQVTRVGFLLTSIYLCVLVFDQGRIVAVYWAVGSAVFAALCSLAYLTVFDNRHKKELLKQAEIQKEAAVDKKTIIRELVICCLPFLLASLIGEANGIINTTFFDKAMLARGEAKEFVDIIYSILNTWANKLTSIPQVLAIGFGVAIIPVMTELLVKKDYSGLRRQINDGFNTASFIALPLVFCLMYFSTAVYATMYGYGNYLTGGEGLRWACLLAITGSVFPLASSIMMAIRLRRKYILSLFVGFVSKLATTYFFIYRFGYPGAMITSALSALVIFLLNLYFIAKTYQVSYGSFLSNLGKMLIGVAGMYGAAKLLNICGLSFHYQSQLKDLITLAVYGIVTVAVYLVISWSLKLPQQIFDIDGETLLRKLRRGKHEKT